MNIKTYYNYYEGELVPLWYVISFKKGDIDWGRTTLYVPIDTQTKPQEIEDYLPDQLGLSVTLGDLTLNASKPGKYGINLSSLRQRAIDNDVDYWDVEQLIIPVSCIVELMHTNVFV